MYVCLVNLVFRTLRGPCDGPIPRAGEFYRVCVCVWSDATIKLYTYKQYIEEVQLKQINANTNWSLDIVQGIPSDCSHSTVLALSGHRGITVSWQWQPTATVWHRQMNYVCPLNWRGLTSNYGVTHDVNAFRTHAGTWMHTRTKSLLP
jgi:hypothetical protein